MSIRTRAWLAQHVAERWHQTYFVDGKWRYDRDTDRLTYEKLLALGPTPTPDEVVAIVDESWVRIRCTSCQLEVEQAWMLQTDEYLEHICEACITLAASEFKEIPRVVHQ